MEFNCFLSFLLLRLFNFKKPLSLLKTFKIKMNKKNKPKCLYKILISSLYLSIILFTDVLNQPFFI